MTTTSFPSRRVGLYYSSEQSVQEENTATAAAREKQKKVGGEELEEVEFVESQPDLQQEEKPLRRIRVLVVDDHEVVRKGISALLSEKCDFELAGEAATSRAALLMTQQLQPDIVLLDIFLGESNGLDIAQQLMRASPDTRIVAFTGSKDDEQLLRAMRLGVHGYVQKAQPLEELLAVLRAVARGERVITEPRSVTRILDEFSRLTKEQERMRSGLTDLEIELIRLAAEGCSNKEIAARQFWSEVTVKRKMQDIYRKLHVTDRAQAVAEAMRMGLI
jgi:DNA-binding NarL/FixJ family response regulator